MTKPTQTNTAEFSVGTGVAGPFTGATLAWLLTAALLCLYFNPGGDPLATSLRWMFEIAAFCLVDLLALGMTLRAVIPLVAGVAEKRYLAALQAFYWATVKLACLGILTAVVLKSPHIPVPGLLTGLGTLIFVPLMGGLWWNQKAYRHA
jgi:hypothetical protein